MRAIGLLLALLVVGCAGQEEINSWQGASFDDLVMTYGSPDRETILADGSRLVEFQSSRLIDATSYSCRIWFIFDSQERVASGGSKGACGLDIMPRQALRSSP